MLALPAEVEPLPVPQEYRGRRRIPNIDFPETITTTAEFLAFIASRLGENPQLDELQKLAFAILQHTWLGPDVLQFVADNCLKSFSKVGWKEVFPYFRHSCDTSVYRDHRAIRPYRLKRSRLPLSYHKYIASQLDISRRTLGRMQTLENESAKQMYMAPIPSLLLSLFSGRLLKLPEHTLKGRITTADRCEFSVTLQGVVMLLFIEFKDSLAGSDAKHSDVIAQIIAEADGADLFNQANESDGVAIHAILTDGRAFEFYVMDFCQWRVLRGVGSPVEAVPWIDPHQICLPSSERAPDYIPLLKRLVEVIFDTILMAYINGLAAQKGFSERCARAQVYELGEIYLPRRSTTFWDEAYTRAINALTVFRHAHGERLVDKMNAERLAWVGLQLLEDSVLSIPHPEMDWSLLDGWDAREDALLEV